MRTRSFPYTTPEAAGARGRLVDAGRRLAVGGAAGAPAAATGLAYIPTYPMSRRPRREEN